MDQVVRFTILGEPASKANSRQIVTIKGRPSSIKSKKARDYEAQAILQIPSACKVMFEGAVSVTMTIYYASERPDLDESVVLDVLQAKYAPLDKNDEKKPRMIIRRGVYKNDRQVRHKNITHAIDKKNPRAEIEVRPFYPQQVSLL